MEKKEAGEEFVREFSKLHPIDAAFWLKQTDIDDWYLYIASPEITTANIDVVYKEVLQILPPNRTPWLDPFRIKLLSSNSKLAQRVIEVRQRYVPTIATHYEGTSIAGIPIDACFIYQQIPEQTAAP